MTASINVGSINFILPHFPRVVNTFLKSVQSQRTVREKRNERSPIHQVESDSVAAEEVDNTNTDTQD